MQTDDLLAAAAARLGPGNSEESRYLAVKTLSRLFPVDALPLLLQAVGDESFRVRQYALATICSYTPEMTFQRLEALLRDNENARLRNASMEAFAKFGARATPFLGRLLQDADEEVRTFAAVVLGEIGDPKAVPSLLKALGDPDQNVRASTIEALGRIGDDRAVVPLVTSLSGEFWIQFAAVHALGEIGDPTAVPALLNILPDGSLQRDVVEALGRIGDPAALAPLGRLLASGAPEVRNEVIGALVAIQRRSSGGADVASSLAAVGEGLRPGELGAYLLSLLGSGDLETRRNAVIALGWLREPRAVPSLVTLLDDYDLEEHVLGALHAIGRDALPTLVSGLSESDPRGRAAALRCIAWFEPTDGIAPCLPMLLDADRDVRVHAVAAVAKAAGQPEVEDALIGRLSDPDDEVRGAAATALFASRSPQLGARLARVAAEGEPASRALAIRVLGQIAAPGVMDVIRAAVRDSCSEVRAESYGALGTCGADRAQAIALLAQGLEDPSPEVRRAIASTFAKLGGAEAEQRLTALSRDPDPVVCLAALEGLGRTGSLSALKTLIDAFGGGSSDVKMAIVRALGGVKDQSGAQLLAELLRKNDPDLRRAALESLGRVGDGRHVPDVVLALDDPDWSVRGAAVAALAKIGDEHALPRLARMLEDGEDLVRKEAVEALAALGDRDAVHSLLPLLHEESLQLEVVSAIRKLGVPDFSVLFRFLEGEGPRVRRLLVEVVGSLRDPRALDGLVSRLRADDSPAVRRQAARSLGELTEKRAEEPLREAQRADASEEVRREASLALGRLKGVTG